MIIVALSAGIRPDGYGTDTAYVALWFSLGLMCYFEPELHVGEYY